MEQFFRDLFFMEQDRGRLNFGDSRAFRRCMTQAQGLFPEKELPNEIEDLIDSTNIASFVYGIRLGIRLAGESK